MGSMQLHSEQRQQGALSPKLQHAVRLLQLSSLDFAQTVQQALGRNPFLEEIDSDDIVTADDTEHDDEALNDADDDAQTSPSAETHDHDAGASARDLWLADPGAGQRRHEIEQRNARRLQALEQRAGSEIARHATNVDR